MKKKLIRRYVVNRKLYDVDGGGYVNLTDFKKILEEYDIQVIDTPSQKDSTAEILLNVLFKNEKNAEKVLSSAKLGEIYRHGGFTAYINYLEAQGKPSCKAQE